MSDTGGASPAPGASGDRPSIVDRVVGRIGKVNAAIGAVVALTGTVTALLAAGPKLVTTWADLRAALGWSSVVVELHTIPRLPAAVLPLLPSQNRVKWVQVKVTNRSGEPVHFSVNFKVARGSAVIDASRPAPEYTVNPRTARTAILDPPIQFTSGFDADLALDITTRIDRVAGAKDPLFTDTRSVTVLRREEFQWDLVDHAGKPLPQEFALASLRGWLVGDETIRQRADAIRQAAGEPGPDFPMRWWRQSYAVFGPSPRLRVGKGVKMPGSGSLTLRTPVETLARGRATPLEAALLLHALRDTLPRNERWPMVLLAVPRDGKAGEQTLFVAWRHDRKWHGLDLREAGSTDFDANLAQATPRVRSLLEPGGPVAKSLKGPGVFIDTKGGVVAVELIKAADHYFHLGER
jgi:hypothetical protein